MMTFTLNEDQNSYTVLSDSGCTYTIRYAGSGDADPEYVGLWECDCPAGKRGIDCRHMSAFLIWKAEGGGQ